MSVSKQRFAGALMAGVVLTGALVGAIMLSGVAVAVPTGGIGGFTVTFDELRGDEMHMYPTMENTSGCSEYPSAVTTIEEGEIDGLHMYKDIEAPTGDTIRLALRSENVQFTGLTQRFTYMNGDFTLNQHAIDQGTTGSISERFTFAADSLTIEDGKSMTQSQFLRSISLDDLAIQTSLNPQDNVSLQNADCAA
jgi:hypothetical protein